MDTSQLLPADPNAISTVATTALRNALIGFVAAAQLLIPTPGAVTPASASVGPLPCCGEATATGTPSLVPPSPPVVVTLADDDAGSTPDDVAGYVGGIATRLHTSDGATIPGNLFLLMATAGSDAPAQLFDETQYTHDYDIAAEALASNIAAADTAETITGIDVDHLNLTTAPGGGPSGGIIYTIAYLNTVSDGAFTGDLRIAATGELGPHGYFDPIKAINEKTAAAHLADADVLFTPSTPTNDHIDAYGARQVGELFRARNTGSTLNEERRLDHYRTWGAERPAGMDIVGTRHIADVAAYLCGAGSGYACEILDILDDTVIGGPSHAEDLEPAHSPMRVDLR